MTTRLRTETGQMLVLVAVALVPLLGMVGLAVDIGYAYFVQRTMQSQVDAAALSGATALPDGAAAGSRAMIYSGLDGAKNDAVQLPAVQASSEPLCVAVSIGGPCAPWNALRVRESADAPTFFLRALGINSLPVEVKAAACFPCAVKPADFMLVLDRTASMFTPITDIQSLKSAVHGFLQLVHPSVNSVGLAVFPPALSLAAKCGSPTDNNYDNASRPYVLEPLTSNFAQIDSTVQCLQVNGRTSTATAIEAAQAELAAHGTAGRRKVIILFADGASNTGPGFLPPTSPYRKTPCAQSIASGQTIKDTGTLIYVIGYGLTPEDAGNRCNKDERNTSGMTGPETPFISSVDALEGIASDNETTSFQLLSAGGNIELAMAEVLGGVFGAALIE